MCVENKDHIHVYGHFTDGDSYSGTEPRKLLIPFFTEIVLNYINASKVSMGKEYSGNHFPFLSLDLTPTEVRYDIPSNPLSTRRPHTSVR